MRTSSGLVAAGMLTVATACAPPDELVGAEQRDIRTTMKQLLVDASIDRDIDLGRDVVTLALDEVVVWSCSLATARDASTDLRVPECSAPDDSWYRGPGLYTFAMGDRFASDVWIHDETIRVQLYVDGSVNLASDDDDDEGDAGGNAREDWRVSAHAYTSGNAIAALKRTSSDFREGLAFVNEAGVDLLKQSMTASLEKWDALSATWAAVPRAPMFLCGTGWNPLMRAGDEDSVYLPLGAHKHAMRSQAIDDEGTYRVSYPFRVLDEEEPRLASVILEVDELWFSR